MLDDFLLRALLAGLAVAVIAGPVGCFVVWRQMAYFGDTLAHSAILGGVLGIVIGISPGFAVFLTALLVGLVLWGLQRSLFLSNDTILGILAHGLLAAGLLAAGFLPAGQFNLTALLFGDILAVNRTDLLVISLGGAAVLAVLARFWPVLLLVTVSPDIAAAENRKPSLAEALLMGVTAAVVALSIKLVGVLLIAALLVIPAATARFFARNPEMMAGLAVLAGCVSVLAGLGLSMSSDAPAGPAIVVAAFVLFILCLLVSRLSKRRAI